MVVSFIFKKVKIIYSISFYDEKKELTDEEMGKVAGGKIYYDDSEGAYVVYNDDGTVAGNYKNQEEAMFHAVGKGTCPYCGKVLS